MKALLAFAIGIVMLASATIVMGVATAEGDELVVDEVVMDEDPVSPPIDSGEGLIIAPPPDADDGSTDTDDEITISPGLWPEDPQEPGEYYNEWVDEWGNIWRTAYYVTEDGTIYQTGIPYLVDENGNHISNDPYMPGFDHLQILKPVDPSSEMQTPDPLSDPLWTFNKISGAGIPDMFIDMDDIFNQIDIPTWQPKNLPEPEWISPDERPDAWIGPWTEPVMIDPDSCTPSGPILIIPS